MKKIICKVVALFLFCSMFFCFCGCFNYNYETQLGEEYDVILVLVEKNGTKDRKTLTSRTSGSTIYNPNEYKIFPSLISGYVVVNDMWYPDENLSSSIFFPYTMPNENVEFYANVRPLTSFDKVNFADVSTVHSYFSSNATLQDIYNTPDETSETSYYEISEYSVATIENVMRYYPATQKLILLRGYSKSENIGSSEDNKYALIVQDEFSIGISIDLVNKTMDCKGIYSRTGISSQTISSGSVTIEYKVNSISIDDTTQPLFPNFATVEYNSTISNATNYTKMKELWDSDGYEFAKKCYGQANTLLKSINNRVLVFS